MRGVPKPNQLTEISHPTKLVNMNLSELASRAELAESFLKAMANRHRLMILCQLHGGERSVSSLQEALGLSQSALSQHLARLRTDALVKTRRESQTIFYSLASPDVSRQIALLYDLFCGAECETRAGVIARACELGGALFTACEFAAARVLRFRRFGCRRRGRTHRWYEWWRGH